MLNKKNQQIDYLLLLGILGLVVVGVILITSIGVPKSIQLTKPASILFPECGSDGVDCFFLVKRHLTRLAIALVGFVVAIKLPYTLWRKLAVPIFAGSFVVLIIVLVVGKAFTTFATSWLVIGGNSLQPTEFAKMGLIFYLAIWLARKGDEIKDFKQGFVSFVVLLGIVTLPVILQPDLGSTAVFVVIGGALYYLAGAPWKHIGVGALLGLLLFAMMLPFAGYQRNRIVAYLSPTEENCLIEVGDTRQDYCWQTDQANIAIGSGGFLGRGLTKGVQKSYWLPQASDDFIFAASAEELGFVRISLLVMLFGFIAYRGFLIARTAPDRFAMFTAAGITVWIVGQALINIGVNTGLLPITGITLPLVSYGGSSLIATMFGAGILLNISKYADNYGQASTNRRRNSRARNAQLGSYKRASDSSARA